MEVGVIGINNKSCPLYLREILTRAFEKIFSQGREFPYILLSTCNRVEIYFAGVEIPSLHVKILALLRLHVHQSFEHVLYSYFESDVFLHLVRVTCGLDSAIIGESDIQRQVKRAYELTRQRVSLPSELHYLFQKSLQVAKQIRSLYDYAGGGDSLENKVFSQITTYLQPITSKKVLFVGNSEMNRKVLALLARKKFQHLALCSRRGVDAEMMEQYPSLQMGGEEMLSTWQEYDVIISATKYPGYVLKSVPRKSAHKMLIFDLSMPRSIDPLFAQDPRTTVLNSEDMALLIEQKRGAYKRDLYACEEAVQRYVMQQFARYEVKRRHKIAFCC